MAISGNGERLPRSVTRRILARAARGEEAVVLTFRKGIPSRVFGLEEYLKMRELPRQVKPWQHRKAEAAVPDPLGAVEGTLIMPVTRENIYDE
jgi:hypothetical protein